LTNGYDFPGWLSFTKRKEVRARESLEMKESEVVGEWDVKEVTKREGRL
jgi:hypothetical protein